MGLKIENLILNNHKEIKQRLKIPLDEVEIEEKREFGRSKLNFHIAVTNKANVL